MQLKSLVCVNGIDNGQRFAVISGLIYFILLLSVVLFSPSAPLYLVAILLTPILALSSLRRLRDSAKSPKLILLTILPFWLVLITLVHIHSMMLLLTLLLLAGLAIGYLALLPGATGTNYVQGYAGPVDMSSSKVTTDKASQRVRVEPTLGGDENAATSFAADSSAEFVQADELAQQDHNHDSGRDEQPLHRRRAQPAGFNMAQLQQALQVNKKWLFGITGALVAVMLIGSVWSLIPDSEAEVETAALSESAIESAPQTERISTAMPDGFSLVLEDDVLIMRWLGESGSPSNLWSLATAKGDKTCSRMRFNDGTEYRPLVVDLLADTGTEARFSPLDTEAIIVDMARRGNVSLCGYNFSLKGSQAALGKVAAFRTYL
ncbi:MULTISPECIES: DUF805 domain-containing protein [unclassified Shewanella]|uniref:DUF805 domain-containing protein n=1 Tax=unclassified Shewanella TaxID=196818 RepID=UPI001BC2840A|nr:MULTISPECIES: DUF805 domain-containing protein [unclassified Shewanella]GIU11417.1 hypothetical protein TUM4444_17320 [Shewanella sp. MBTL60-112-B1]GIU31153.1 hypothetical protein TUM4445_15300 [Shewanella sp. MBTL60-112-B2]